MQESRKAASIAVARRQHRSAPARANVALSTCLAAKLGDKRAEGQQNPFYRSASTQSVALAAFVSNLKRIQPVHEKYVRINPL